MKKSYFPNRHDAPGPLRLTVLRHVRFEEVDPLGIVWHGRYASFFEDARTALGDKYGIGYNDFYRHGVVCPVRIMHIDYLRPLSFQDEFSIEGILHWTESPRMNCEFVIRDREGNETTTGYSVQLMLDIENNLLMVPPPFYLEFCRRWKAGEWP